ncbi:MAG TPA: hypothetical protein VIT67_23240 [Povalibacter sp.]
MLQAFPSLHSLPAQRALHNRCLPGLLYVVLMQLAAASTWAAAAPGPVTPSWQQEYWARLDKHDWDAAIASAEQLVAAARPASAKSGLRLAEALTLLGNAQLGKGNLVAAEAAYSESLSLTEKYTDRSSARLVDPLRGMGYTLVAGGKHAKAIPYMDRALLISRRTAGLFDVSQQGLLRQLAISQAAVGSPVEGEKHMQYLVRLAEHAYGEKDPRMVSVHCAVGRWYADVAQMEQARQSYRTALGLAERSEGRNELLVVEPLRGLARTFTEEIGLRAMGIETRKEGLAPSEDTMNQVIEPFNPRYIPTEGERSLIRALKVLESNPKRSTATLIETLVQTGDWFTMKMQPSKAFAYYGEAASVIAGSTGQADDADAGNALLLLSFPAQVYYPPPPLANRNLMLPPEAVTERFAQVEFTVLPNGVTRDGRVVDHDASDRQVQQTLDAIEGARYRPKFVDGKPVETLAVSFRQMFRDRKQSE